MEKILIIDIGGTKTNVFIAVPGDGKINFLRKETFLTDANPEKLIYLIGEFAKNENIESASLSLPGKWSNDGVLIESYFLHTWLEFPFIKTLEKTLDLKKSYFETDVICGGLGEYYYGDHENIESLLYINLGTGIGASLIINGKPYKQKNNLSLRLQKLVLPFDEDLYSGVDLISGGSLINASGFESTSALFHAYKNADINAMDIISRAQVQLSAWLINLFYLFAPDKIVLNGGLTYDHEVLVESAIELAQEELQHSINIVPSKLKDLAPIYGAFTILK